MRRVVITGLGVVSCLGNNQDEVYQSLLNSKSGISFAEEYKEHNLKSHVHGKPKIKLEDHIDRKTIRFMGSGSAYNYIAMKEAIKDSGLEEKDISNFKTGIVMVQVALRLKMLFWLLIKHGLKHQNLWDLLLF